MHSHFKNHIRLSEFLNILLIFSFQFSVFNFISCTKRLTPEEIEIQNQQKIENAKNSAISEYVKNLSDEVRLSQLFLVNIEGNETFHAVEKTGSLHEKPAEGNPLVPGGVLLFSYNISNDPLQTYEYIKSIRDFYLANGNPPPFVSVDQEGGYVNRLRSLTATLCSQQNAASSLSPVSAQQLYASQARQMNNLGFHLNLAPVIEVENDENRDFLDTRSFGNIGNVLIYGKTCVSAYENNKIATVLKHFPGNSSTDPHTGLPEISVTREILQNQYLLPFKNLNSLSSAVLMSHARITVSDDSTYTESKNPACLSKYWVTDVLRNELGFKGLILSDDIFMAALAKNGYPPETAVISAVEAGIDVIMLSEKRFGKVAGIILKKACEDENFSKEINRAAENVIRFKIKAGILNLIKTSQDSETELPQFKVEINKNYADFDLYRFNEDYKAGMNAFEMKK
ncbi:glycoside hydrolase family 3 N-terminal domain-containing protein [Treponema sp.]|uniref:glycoside hydrolase family 3 N-terminal domain-containing protein n=1 Tax=Treponema sp. TaxID=166 RepID=UPI00388E7294